VDFDEKQLLDAIASPGLAASLKGLQDRKLVFVCVQNDATKSNAAAMKGVQDFKADRRFSGTTEIVILDPAKTEESKFLGQLGVAPDTKEAVTVFLAPPGTVVGKFQGATKKSQLEASLQKAAADCGTGCGPVG